MSKVSNQNRIDNDVCGRVQARLKEAVKNKISYLDLNDIDVSHVKYFSNMFYEDPYDIENNFTGTIDISKWDTSNAKSLLRMFNNAVFENVIGISNLDTTNVTIMDEVFMNCKIKSPIDISGWNMSKVRSVNYMFSFCAIPSVGDLSKWVTSNIVAIDRMFEFCKTADFGDLTKWDLSEVQSAISVFDNSTPGNKYIFKDNRIALKDVLSKDNISVDSQIINLLNKVPKSIKNQGIEQTLEVMQNLIKK